MKYQSIIGTERGTKMPAYPNYYQNPYQAYGQPYFQQQYQQPPQMQQAQAQPVQNVAQSQIQNGGFIPVRSEEEARSFPVALGTSVTFKHETEPYCYTKTRGFSQFDAPHFEKFRLVKEEDEVQSEGQEKPASAYAKETDLDKLAEIVKSLNENIKGIKGEISTIQGDLYGLSGRKKAVKKAEAEDDT